MNDQAPRVGWQYYVHNGMLALLAPALAGYAAWRFGITKKSRDGFWERMGRYPDEVRRLHEGSDPIIWVHAVSVGEVATAASILAELRKLTPLARIVLSTTTSTGRETAEKRGLNADGLVYFPFDLPWSVNDAFDALRPDLLVTIDTELWPNLLELARNRGVKTAVANARFSDHALRLAWLFRWHYRWIMGNVDAVLAQSKVDAERYISLGADPECVEVTGSTKFDEDFPEVSPAAAAKLRQDLHLAPDVPVWVVGSTRENEESIILDAFRDLRMSRHDVQLIIAPRHPERGDEVERLVRDRGYHALRRTRMQNQAQNGEAQPAPEDRPEDTVLILDTIGELARVYAVADVVTVGGSFVRWGGHNMLQPMAQGKPVIFGPHTHNFRDIVSLSKEAEAVVEVGGPDELAEAVGRILSSDAEGELLSVRAQRVVRENRGASARTAARLVELLNAK